MGMLRRGGGVWDFFARLFGLSRFSGGEITLSYGDHLISVLTEVQPKNVWLSVETPDNAVPVCCGDINLFGVRVTRFGFEVNAKVRTESVRMEYFIEF
jgi:hypothetical protein